MAYPINNLKKDFEDININNRIQVKEYSDKSKTAIETGDFTDVQNYYNTNKDILDKVIINASTINNIVAYIEELMNYTITTKNQIHYCDIDISEDEFNALDTNLVEGDMLIYTESDDLNTMIRMIRVKQSDGSYETIYQIVTNIPMSNTFYFDVNEDDIVLFENSTENFDYYNYGHTEAFGIVTKSKFNFSSTSQYKDKGYIDLSDKIDVSALKDGDIVSIRYISNGDKKNLTFFKIENIFYLVDCSRGGNINGLNLSENNVYNFVYDSDALGYSSSYGNAGYIVYDDLGNESDIIPSGFISNNCTASNTEYTNIYDFSSVKEALDSILPNTPTKNVIFVDGVEYVNWYTTTWTDVDFKPISPSLLDINNSSFGDVSNYITTTGLYYMRKNNNLYLSGNLSIDLSSFSEGETVTQIPSCIRTDITSQKSASEWLHLGVLPEGCRPSKDRYFTMMGSGNCCFMIGILSSGDIVLGRYQGTVKNGQKLGFMPIEVVCALDF